jgi:hypothetical protein
LWQICFRIRLSFAFFLYVIAEINTIDILLSLFTYFTSQRQLEFGLGYNDLNGSFSSIDWQNLVHWCLFVDGMIEDRRDVADNFSGLGLLLTSPCGSYG